VDDKNFDQKTADEWIRTIEDPTADIRKKDIYPLISDWLVDSKAKNVLDIGCGQGVCSAHLGTVQVRYTGIDPSSDLIFRANKLYADPSRNFVNGNAYGIPFGDEYFDSVFSVAVWHLLSDLSKASCEMSRVLKRGGKFLIITADPNQREAWMDRYAESKFDGDAFIGRNLNPDGTLTTDTLYLRDLDEIVAHLKAAGLAVSGTKTIRSFVAIFGDKK
jgi:SAM-dependent methyltransferase